MGRRKSSKRKTNFAKVFSIVERSLKRKSKTSTDKVIFQFFQKLITITDLNRCLTGTYSESVHQRYLLRVLFLKVILPLETLRSLHLAPPAGVEADQWVCFAGPCSSSDRYRCQNSKVLHNLRISLGQQDGLDPDFYSSFERSWGDFARLKPADNIKRPNLGPYSPLILFPVKSLPDLVIKNIQESVPGIPSDLLQKLFICTDHFGPANGVTLDPSLRSDTVFNYSLEYLNEILLNGSAVFRLGRKGWRNLPFLSMLEPTLKNKPPFTDPMPVDDEALRTITTTLAGGAMDEMLHTPHPSDSHSR